MYFIGKRGKSETLDIYKISRGTGSMWRGQGTNISIFYGGIGELVSLRGILHRLELYSRRSKEISPNVKDYRYHVEHFMVRKIIDHNINKPGGLLTASVLRDGDMPYPHE